MRLLLNPYYLLSGRETGSFAGPVRVAPADDHSKRPAATRTSVPEKTGRARSRTPPRAWPWGDSSVIRLAHWPFAARVGRLH